MHTLRKTRSFENEMIKRVFIEGTTTYLNRCQGGIHRVVHAIVEESQSLQAEFDVDCSPVVLIGERLRDARSIVFGQMARSPIALLMKAWRERIRWLTGRDTIAWRDSDLLLLLDSSWGRPIWPAIQKAKDKGVSVGLMVHDLIPIRYPEFCAETHVTFRQWLEDAIAHVDFFIGNSQTTILDLKQFLRETRPDEKFAENRFDSFCLGADFSRFDSPKPVRTNVQQIFLQKNAPYLVVCTIEPRKNHSYLMDAFDRIWRESPETNLCIAGRIGWQCDEIVVRIREHPRYGSSLFMFNDLCDDELRFCYENAKAFIFPSIVEGFGIPIVEALIHGLSVFASDTPIHREVGTEHCRYFDLNNSESLSRMILAIENNHVPLDAPASTYEPTMWKDSCRELLTKSFRMAAMARANPTRTLGACRGSRTAA